MRWKWDTSISDSSSDTVFGDFPREERDYTRLTEDVTESDVLFNCIIIRKECEMLIAAQWIERPGSVTGVTVILRTGSPYR